MEGFIAWLQLLNNNKLLYHHYTGNINYDGSRLFENIGFGNFKLEFPDIPLGINSTRGMIPCYIDVDYKISNLFYDREFINMIIVHHTNQSALAFQIESSKKKVV